MQLQILDLDGSVQSQNALVTAAAWSGVRSVDLRDLGPALRLWSRDKTIRAARKRLLATGSSDCTLTFLGSGDFHHVAVLLMEQAREPITVIHIDNHPDWVRLAPRWHCGSWVNRAIRLPHVAKVITLGPCSDDLVKPGVKGGNLPALAAGKIVLIPWLHEPSRVYHPIPDGPGHRYENGFLIWNELGRGNLQDHLLRILSQIDTDAVWLSIDKDVLPEREALTNWDQGQMPLAAVQETIETITRGKRIVGADICGEYSPPQHANPFKRWEANMDQPPREIDAQRVQQNERINCELAGTIAKAARAC